MFSETIEKKKAQHLYRTRRVLESAQGPEVILEGKRYLAFCSNDYLGLANHPEVVQSFQRAAAQYGVGSGASALVIGHHRVHRALEQELADFLQRPAALVFSTGAMANLGTLSALITAKDTVVADRWIHASLLDGIRLSQARLLRYQHGNLESFQRQLDKANPGHTFIVTEGVFSMEGDLAPLPALVQAAKTRDAILYVDDAHGLGVIGQDGGGVCAHFGLGVAEVPILIGTFGKAFGTSGAFVSGTQDFIEYLIQCARTYIYTTALPPAIAEATRTSLNLIQQERWRQHVLQERIAQFREGVTKLGLSLLPSQTPIQPLILGSAEKALEISEKLWEAGIYIPAIRPPTVPVGQARLRITVSAAHTKAQIQFLIQQLARIL